MHADDVVLVGSPGMDLAHSAADFHLNPGGHVYVGSCLGRPGHVVTRSCHDARNRPSVGRTRIRPRRGWFGSTRFKAEVPGFSANPLENHSHYFDKGSESLFSIADVVSGHGDALQHDGMTAHHRGEYLTPEWVDPEAVRPGTTGHQHSAPTG
jgi:Uri superfamily endonuclease